MPSASVHEHWSSRLVFLMASVGFAVGLGNIWKFPYVAGENGGGAFVLVYLLCAFGIGVPVLMAELLIGRRGRLSPPTAMAAVATAAGASRRWGGVGVMAVLAATLILTFYSVIGGWAMAYVVKAAGGAFAGLDGAGSQAMFDGFLANPGASMAWQGLFIGVTVWIIARGVERGIERAVTVLMPALLILLLALVAYAAVAGDFAQGLRFLFEPDFSKIDGQVVLVAVGQAFFSIGIAMAAMMTYGAYLPQTVSIPRSAMIIVSADTLVALLAGIAIFPLVFAFDLEPGEGPGLIFATLPVAFGQMAGGRIFSTLFFVLLVLAAVTSSIGGLEPLISWAEEHKGIKRAKAALISGAVIWFLGLGTVFSFNIWADVAPLGRIAPFAEMTFFQLIDYATSNLMLPLGGLLIAVFAGWFMTRQATREELRLPDGPAYWCWRFSIRYVAPVAIAVILVSSALSAGG